MNRVTRQFIYGRIKLRRLKDGKYKCRGYKGCLNRDTKKHLLSQDGMCDRCWKRAWSC